MVSNVVNRPAATPAGLRRAAFYSGLLFLCASTLMYEIVLTRLLSVVCWYYLAFVSISMAMFGMTAGALAVQLRPERFTTALIPQRLFQATIAAAVSMPLALMTMLSVPVDVSLAVQTAYTFLLFSAIISIPFFFSGVAVCLSLTRMPFPMGRIYFADMTGAALGCGASIALLSLIDAPSGIFAISALLFASAALYSVYASEYRRARLAGLCAAAMLILAGLNASTLHGIQPIWTKGALDLRMDILTERWNPISRVRAAKPVVAAPLMWGRSARMPYTEAEQIALNIDSDAYTPISRYHGDLKAFDYLRYDVTSIGAQLRRNAVSAAIIGVGGGRDVLNCAANGIHRIVGIEVNSAIVDLTMNKLEWFSGFRSIPGFELHNDEGRSYLSRSSERFDLVQASLVDTWAATSAGALTLSENALYTVDGWRVFYRSLKPGGIITFSRWFFGPEKGQTYRLFSVAKAMLLAEGVAHPEQNLALIASDRVATLLASNQPLSNADLSKLRAISDDLAFTRLYLPGEQAAAPELRRILAARNLAELAALRGSDVIDYSPVFDSSPYFFNAVHLSRLGDLVRSGGHGSNLRAMLFLLGFLLAAAVLVIFSIVLPAWLLQRKRRGSSAAPGAIAYFVAIGLGFLFVEMAMMQQLSIFLGHPIYSLAVVLAGLVSSTGIGSLVSDRLPLRSAWQSRIPALAASVIVAGYSVAVLPVAHAYTAEVLWQRIAVALALVIPCGFALGFCFPVGMRWMKALGQEQNLPWMWALNGAAGALGSFAAMVVSMDSSIGACVLTGAGCYLLAGLVMPGRAAP